MEIRPFRADEGMLIKQVRLRSLIDAPYAFGFQSYSEEAALPDPHWHELAVQVGGKDARWKDRCVSYVVLDGGNACSMATCYLCPEVAERAYVTGAWIDPAYRRCGVGRALLEQAIEWAAARGTNHLRLWVDDSNPEAVKFYLALGFAATGENRSVCDGSADRQSCFERLIGGH